MTTIALKPIDQIRTSLSQMGPQFRMALPSHISTEKFQRVAITAIQQTPALLEADRKSLFGACIRAAQDGLLPDGREAALVVFGRQVQYMPMVAGILKKVRNSGDLSSITAHVVYQEDTFDYTLGDDEHIVHKPALSARGKTIAVYAIAKMKDGGIAREVMSVEDVEKVRNVSRSKDSGPWKTWYDEMAKKTVIRRLAKYLPQSTDKDGFHETLHADDEMYEGEAVTVDMDPAPAPAPRPRKPRALEAVAAAEAEVAPADEPGTYRYAADADPETGEIYDTAADDGDVM